MRQRFFRWLDRQLSSQFHDKAVLKRGDYVSHPDIEVFRFGDEETIIYAEPDHFGELLPEYVNTMGACDYPAPFILAIKNGQLRGKHALVLTDDQQIIAESVFNHLPYIEVMSIGRVHYPQSVSHFFEQMSYSAQYEEVYVLANYFGNAYYHWILETLPRLWLLQQYQTQVGRKIPVLLTRPLPNFAKETLDLFGIEDIVVWDATAGQAKNLLMPMAINGTGIPSPYIMKQVSQQIIAKIGRLPKVDSPRIYISRENSYKRRVMNEDAVLALLEHYGFVAYRLEDLSLAEQIALFQQAEIVIGAHGAGFANCIHSQNIKLLEFFEPSYINLCFYRLAFGYGFDYGYLLGQSQGLNIEVDVAALERMMQQMHMIE